MDADQETAPAKSETSAQQALEALRYDSGRAYETEYNDSQWRGTQA